MSGVLSDAVNAVTTVLSNLGIPWTTDPRNARPLSVIVELPTSENFTFNVANIAINVQILAPPPANQDAATYLLTTADAIMNSAIAVTAMRPSSRVISGQEMPAYDLTVAVAVRRN